MSGARRRHVTRAAGRLRLGVVAILLFAAGAFVALEPWRGPTVLSLSEAHGVDLADLPALALLVLALLIARARENGARAGGRAPAVAAILLGVLLVTGMVAPRIGAPLVPAGGGTFGGSVVQVSGVRAQPVGRWTHLAVTYDGATVRLYVDGAEVAGRSQSGVIGRTADPLWIGGNRPYGEYFLGTIDEVRVYDRALGAADLRDAMAMPIDGPGPGRGPRGLVAAYSFDANRGATLPDDSGHGNAGTIRRASWTSAGRFGGAVRFEHAGDVVRVPASASLDLRRAMTLAAWIEPSEPQSGWRTVLARQTDAYTLMAGGGRQDAGRLAVLDGVRFALVVLLAALTGWAVARGYALWGPGRRRWLWPLSLFVAGSVLDVALAPSNSVIGPALVAGWWAAGSDERSERLTMSALAFAFAAVTALSLAEPTTELLPYDNGGVVRAAALGLVFATAGHLSLWRDRRASAAGPRALV